MNMGEIREALAYTGWDPSTIKTLVTRLVKKGELVQTRIKVYYYEPTVTREEYGSNLLQKSWQRKSTAVGLRSCL